MSRILRFLAVSIALTIAAPAAAQVQTGSILVRAVDEQGAVVPGVTVTITSPVLVAGSMTGVTDAGGVFRFPSLVPGTYLVKMELTGFQTITAKTSSCSSPDNADRLLDEGREPRRVDHCDERVASRGHDERQPQCHAERTADSGHPGRSRHLGARRGEGSWACDQPAGTLVGRRAVFKGRSARAAQPARRTRRS
jgi:hypothetical protein